MITYPTTDSQQCPPAPGDRSKNDSDDHTDHGDSLQIVRVTIEGAGSTKVGSAVFQPPVRRQGMNSR
jgi:hypothetical protein